MNPKKTLKIAHVVCVLPPYGGGIGIAAHQQANMMADLGHHVTVFSPTCSDKRETKRKYKIDQLWSILKLGHAALMPSLLWKLWKFDVVHLHYPFFGSALLTLVASFFKGRKQKLVVSYHQDLILTGWRGLYYRWSTKWVLPLMLRQADKIIVSSQDYIKFSQIQVFYEKHINRFVELPFGVPEMFKPLPKKPEFMRKFNFLDSDFIVLFVGGLDWAHYFKGVNYLIQAIEEIPNKRIKALVVGSGNLKKQYERQTEKLGLQNRVKFAGYIEEKDLPEHYNLADTFILPSINKNEAFGIVLVEAMACGMPLIASNLKGVRSVVESGENGLLTEPKNFKDIANKITQLAENSAMYNKFKETGLRLVREKYRFPVIAQKLEQIYLKLYK